MTDTTHPAPPFDPECGANWARVREVFADGFVLSEETLELTRGGALFGKDMVLAGRAVSEQELQIPGPAGEMTLSVFTPEGGVAPGAPGLYWLHGGGMVTGTRYLCPEALDMAAAVGAVVASVEYRLAPEHPAPAPQDDCYAGLLWVAEHADELGIDTDRLVMGGSSAGGGLAAATALRVRDHGGPGLVGLYLGCPMLDDRMITVAANQFGDDLLWTRASNEFGWRSLLGDRAGTDDVTIYDAPGRATDLSGLPPTFIDVGSCDLFRDEDVAFASHLWASGGDCELHVWPGGFHGFELFAPEAPLSTAARAVRPRWLERTLAKADATG